MAKGADISRFLPPEARKLRRLTARRTKQFADRRKRKRITIEEINTFGVKKLSSEQREAITKAPDKRSAFTKFLDIIDVPRNTVANIIGSITGVDKAKLREGTLQKKVFASDILDKLGVKPGVGRAVLGFGLDVLADPLTYLTAGATTGARIAAGAPKVLKGGTRALRSTARAAAAGNVAGISADVARALGRTPAQLAKIGQRLVKRGATPKQAARQLFGRKGGKFASTLGARAAGGKGVEAAKQARKFFTKFGEKGRTIARVPFAAKGFITARRGKRARLFTEFAKGVPKDVAAQITGKGLERVARAGAFAKTAGLARIGRAQAAGRQVAETSAAVQAGVNVRRAQRAFRILARDVGLRATPEQVKQIQRFKRIIEGGGKLPKAQIERLAQRATSPVAKQAFRDIGRLEQATEAARRAGQVIPKARIQSEAKTKKILQGVLSGEARVRQAQKGKLGAEAAAFSKEATRQEALSLGRQFDPRAPESVRQATRATFGKLRTTDPSILPGGSTAMNRLRVDLGRFKQRLFGPGHSELGARAAGAEAAVRARAPAAEVMAINAWTKEIDPIIAALAQRSGQSVENVGRGLLAMLDAPDVTKLVASDPARGLVAAILPHMDDASRGVIANYKKLHSEALAALRKRGIAPGSIEPVVLRRVTDKFARESFQHVQRTLVDLGFNPKRVKELQFTHPQTGVIESALTSNPEKVKRLQSLAADAAEQFPGSPGIQEFDISIARFRTDPNLAKRLLPPGRRGAIPQFKESIPEAAGSLVKQSIQMEAFADIADISRKTGIDAKLLANNPNQFRGFAQFRGGDFAKSPAYQTMFKQFEGRAFPQQIIDVMNRFMDLSQTPTEIRKFWRMSDMTLNLWKGVTLLHPAYSIRNGVQNLLGNLMAGQRMGPYLKQARPGSEMHRATKSIITGKPVTGTILTNGRLVPLQHFVDIGLANNYVGSGQMSQITNWAQSPSKLLRSKAGAPLRKWFSLNNEMESTMKLASYWGFLDQGMDAQQAAQAVARAMPDLSDLTKFERNIARRLIPFYSWMRKNGALQLFHYLPQKPAFLASTQKIKDAVERGFSGDNVVPESLRPEWMRNQQAVQVGGDKERGTAFLLASWLPFQELVKLGSGVIDPDEGFKGAAETLRPSIRFAAERATGQDIFRRAPVQPLTTAGIPGAIPKALIGRGPLGPVLGVRPLREAFRVAEVAEAGGTGAGVARAFVGGAFQPVSAQRGLGAEFQRLRGEAVELRRQVNRALQSNDQPQAQQLQSQLLQVLLQLHQMGLPGVPKSTQQIFEQAGLQAGPPAFGGQ